jgi:hypothetical protein
MLASKPVEIHNGYFMPITPDDYRCTNLFGAQCWIQCSEALAI